MKGKFLSSKRILYHHRTQGQGVEGVHIRGMIDGFRNCGYQVDIIGPPGIDPFKKISVKANLNNTLFFNRLWGMLSKNIPQIAFEGMELCYNYYAYKKLNRMVNSHNYDFLYERYALNNIALTYLAHQYGIPLVLEINDAAIIKRSRPCILKNMAKLIEKKIFHRATLLITITDYFKQLIVDQYKVSETKILVLPNAIDPKRFELNPLRTMKAEDLGIKAKYIIGCVGAFVQWHGLDFLIQATYNLLEEMDIHILLVGDGPARKSVEKIINNFHIHKRVTITGFIDPHYVPYYIQLFDIGLMTNSNMHGSPMKIFEYMAMGIPTIAAAYPPLKELIDDGINGSLFTPYDQTLFREKIKALLKDKNMRKRMGKAARAKVIQQFTWQRNVEKLLSKIIK